MTQADVWIDFTDSANDWLGRKPAVTALKRMLDKPGLPTPLVLGIYGGWGTGKTSLMRTLQSALDRPEHIPVWFDSWVYARQDEALWRALLLRVIEELRARTVHPDSLPLIGDEIARAQRAYDTLWRDRASADAAAGLLDQAADSLYRSVSASGKGRVRVNWAGALPLAADLALTALTAGLSKEIAASVAGKDGPTGPMAAVAKWFKGGDTKEVIKLFEREATETYVAQVQSLDQFQEAFRKVTRAFGIGAKDGGEIRLFVFVDDLDRCLPEEAVAALEAVKLFLDYTGCVFILGMDRAVVEQGISIRYKDLQQAGFDGRAYLDKIIQVPFNLPPLGRAQIDTYLDTAAAQSGLDHCRDLIGRAAPANPRTVKRVLNAILLTLYLDGHDDQSLAALTGTALARVRRLAKLVILQVCFEPVWLAVTDRTLTLLKLEDMLRPVQSNAKNLPGVVALSDNQFPRLAALFAGEPVFAGTDNVEIDSLLTVIKLTARPGPASVP